MVVKSKDGRELRSFNFKDEDESQEVRAVERGILLETLANQLPPNAISFSSKLKSIEKSEDYQSLLTFEDNSQILAKGRDVYILGSANVGKSAFINALLRIL